MNYKVLYRKYRPETFETLVGQESIVRILKQSIIDNKISHAYIFSGPRGTGKTSTARILAKTINCLNNSNGVPCEKCDNCLNFSTNPDIIEIDAASNNGVDEIRELINNVKLMPTSSKYKVYIIDEVHMLSQSAFNALLLTLEEPPAHVVFILATTNIESVPITILSRCQKFEFNKISDELITEQLEYICKKEKIEYTKEGLQEIALLSDGGMRDALSILDQISKEDKKIDVSLVESEIGSISLNKLADIYDSINNNDIDKLISIIDTLKKENVNYKVVIKKLIDVLAQKTVESIRTPNRLTYKDIKCLILELNECINNININVNPYTILQVILLNYVDNGQVINNNKDTKVTHQEDVKIFEEVVKEPVKSAEESILTQTNDWVNIRINNCFVDAARKYKDDLSEKWEEFKSTSRSSKVKGLIADTQIVAGSDKYGIITSSIEHKDEEINDNISSIENQFNKKYNLNIRFVAISDKTWENEKKKYIENKKNGIKYLYKSEEKNDEEMELLANELFASDKIEIEGE